MSDNLSSQDTQCKGCVRWVGSYMHYPCSNCSNAFSGCQTNFYAASSDVSVELEDTAVWSNPFENLGTKEEVPMISDSVKHPKHYKLCNMEAIDIIKSTLTKEQFNGFLLGNVLKYRLRAAKKGDGMEDLRKANQYEELWDMYND